MEEILQFVEQRLHAAGRVEIREVVLARGLQIDEHRRAIGDLVDAVERDVDAAPAGDGGQVDDRVRGSAERHQHRQRVLDGLRRDDLRRPRPLADHGDGPRTARLGRADAVRVDRRDRRRVRQAHAERLGERRHRARGAHHGAGAGGRREVPLDRVDALVAHLARAVLRPEAAAVGAGAEPFAAERHRDHRTGHELDRRQVGGRRAHQLRRHRLVAAADEHDGVHRLRVDHLLGVHRHEVAEQQARRAQEDLAERHRRERERESAGREHAALHGFDEFGNAAMAVVEVAGRLRDADDRAVHEIARQAGRLRERAAQVEREGAVAVVGEIAAKASGVIGHGGSSRKAGVDDALADAENGRPIVTSDRRRFKRDRDCRPT
jgi:hypothetical protein